MGSSRRLPADGCIVLPIRHVPATGPTDGIGGGDSKSRAYRAVSPGSPDHAKRLNDSFWRVPALREQVYPPWQTVADLPTQPVTTSPTDWPPPTNSLPWEFASTGIRPGTLRRMRPRMRSSSQQSDARPLVPTRDLLGDELVGAPSRHAKARVSPQVAHAAGGKSLVPFWRRWWRSL